MLDMDEGDIDALLRRLAFAEAVTRATPDCLYVYDVTSNEFRYQNMTVQEFLGYDLDRLAAIPGDFYAYVGHPDELDAAMRAMHAQRTLPQGQMFDQTYRLRRGDGEYRWHTLRVVTFSSNPDGSPREVLGMLRDVHESVVSTERLNESERRFRELFDRSPSGIALIDDDGRFVEVNDALCEFLARNRLELLTTSYDLTLHPEDLQDARAARVEYRQAEGKTHRQERRFVRPDGSVRWARTSVTRVDDEGEQVSLVSFEDVTATKEVEERLRHAALHDSLTGLPNRRMLVDALDHALSRRRRTLQPLAVMFVDLDRIKQVNDRLGHEAGDALLVSVSRRLEATMRGTDTVARVGGDEFVIVCPDLDSESEVATLAHRVLDAVRVCAGGTPGDELAVSGSIGIVLASDALDNPNALIRAADRAMYQAKHQGRDRYVVAGAAGDAAGAGRTWVSSTG